MINPTRCALEQRGGWGSRPMCLSTFSITAGYSIAFKLRPRTADSRPLTKAVKAIRHDFRCNRDCRLMAVTNHCPKLWVEQRLCVTTNECCRPHAGIALAPLQTFKSLLDHLVATPQDHLRNRVAEPKRWMRVAAPVAAALRLTPACLIRCVAMAQVHSTDFIGCTPLHER